MHRQTPALALGILCLFAAPTSCKYFKGRDKTKPPSVPSDAVDIGGFSRLQWARCVPVRSVYKCTVYGGYGTVLAKGYFELFPAGQSFNPYDSKEYQGWIGEEMALSRKRFLRPIAPPRPFGIPPEAQWSGGASCGAFFKCSQEPGGIRCEVYDESTGAIRLSGLFREERTERAVDLLRGGLRLCPANPKKIFQEGGGVLELMDAGAAQ